MLLLLLLTFGLLISALMGNARWLSIVCNRKCKRYFKLYSGVKFINVCFIVDRLRKEIVEIVNHGIHFYIIYHS